MGKIKSILGASILLLVSVQVIAEIINTTNTNTEYDTGKFADLQGLEWLSLDETLNIPRSDIESGYNNLINEGWRYATRSETETLLTSLWGGSVDGWSSTNYYGADWFLNEFGYTFHLIGTNTANYRQGRFIFGNVGECSSRLDFICYGAIETFDNNTSDIPGYLNDGSWTFTTTYFSGTGKAGDFEDIYGLNAGRTDSNITVTEPSYNNGPFASLLVRTAPAQVTIDIKPGNNRNKINPNSKKRVTVAVLGSIDFDATQGDFSTVAFGPAEAPPVHDGHVDDVNDDGFMDMMFHFKTQETGIVCGDTEATLTGATFDGIQFTGTDTVHTVGCK